MASLPYIITWASPYNDNDNGDQQYHIAAEVHQFFSTYMHHLIMKSLVLITMQRIPLSIVSGLTGMNALGLNEKAWELEWL